MTEIVASSLVNIVKFKIDMASYRRTLKAIDNVKAKLKSLNNGISNSPALTGGMPSPRTTKARVSKDKTEKAIHNYVGIAPIISFSPQNHYGKTNRHFSSDCLV